MTEGDDETVQERFEAAMCAEEARKAAWELGLPLDPDGDLDFEIALTNLDKILSAITTGEKGPALGATHIPPLLMPHLPDPRASDLFRMWANLNDLEDFTAPESDGNRDVQTAIRQAATEWGLIQHADEATVSAYCDRWIAKCDFVLWRDRMDSVPWGGGLSGVMPGVAQLPVVMPVVEVVSVSRVPSSSANDASVR